MTDLVNRDWTVLVGRSVGRLNQQTTGAFCIRYIDWELLAEPQTIGTAVSKAKAIVVNPGIITEPADPEPSELASLADKVFVEPPVSFEGNSVDLFDMDVLFASDVVFTLIVDDPAGY